MLYFPVHTFFLHAPLPAVLSALPLQDQLAACTSLYVEDQLGSHFKALLEFVKKAEQVQKRGGVQEGQPITGARDTACFGCGSCGKAPAGR
jgi:hypothetical protein